MTNKLPKFSSKAFLAPMAGVSDPALRLLCKKSVLPDGPDLQGGHSDMYGH